MDVRMERWMDGLMMRQKKWMSYYNGSNLQIVFGIQTVHVQEHWVKIMRYFFSILNIISTIHIIYKHNGVGIRGQVGKLSSNNCTQECHIQNPPTWLIIN